MRTLLVTDVSANLPRLPQAADSDALTASFPMRRTLGTLLNKTPQRAPHQDGAAHAHGGGAVPLDLDEAAYGAKCAASSLGPWAQRVILGGGIWYALSGSVHALQDLRAWPASHARVARTNQKLAEPLGFRAHVDDAQQAYAQSNRIALQRLASTHNFNSYAGCVLAAASFVGCLFMGLGLAFDEQMLGHLLPSLILYTGSCMNIAVPMMVLYALGVAATAGWDFVSNWGRADYLGSLGDRAQARLPEATAVNRTQTRAFQVAKRSVGQRQTLSGMATLAGIAMGVGIYVTCNFSTWGLALMLPGALPLPNIMAARHSPEVDVADLAIGINRGSFEQLSHELVRLDERISTIKATAAQGIPTRSQRRLNGRTLHENTIPAADRLIVDSFSSAISCLESIPSDESNRAADTRLQSFHLVMTALRSPDKRTSYKTLCEQIIGQIVEDDLFETFAFEIAKDPRARTQLCDVDTNDQAVNISIAGLRQHLNLALNNEAELKKYTNYISEAYLVTMLGAGCDALEHEKNKVLDLWLARVQHP